VSSHFSRVVVGLWLLVSLVMTSGFASNLRALLIRPKLEDNINSVDDLILSGKPYGLSKNYFIWFYYFYGTQFYEDAEALPLTMMPSQKVSEFN